MSEVVIAAPQAVEPDPAPPNWAAIQEEIHCPLCEYNLRGLIKPRCLECGYAFIWAELLEIDRRLHPYLFEHHPERPIWSFVKTVIGGLRPWKFWKSMHPAQPCRPTRLMRFAAWMLVPVVLIWVALLGSVITERMSQHNRARQWERAFLTNPQTASEFKDHLKQIGGVEGYLDRHYPITILGIIQHEGDPSRIMIEYASPSIMVVTWPIATLLALCVFEISRRRVKIARIHFVRAVVYSADLIWWIGLIIFFITLLSIAAGFGLNVFISRIVHPLTFLVIAGAAAVIAFGVRLCFAYRRYLRFPHAVWVVLSSQIIAGLIVFKLALDLRLIR
jgi:hypothetical protein